MTLYERYRRSAIDFSKLGLERGDTRSDYFCTPKGTTVIGWTGVDGIHYCLVKGFQEVFSVSPMEGEGQCVHPVARDFDGFLRLLLACRGEAAIEQAHAWDREQFMNFLRENPPSPEQQTVLKTVEEEFSLTPMEDPFSYIKELQAEFDYSRIPYKAGYAAIKEQPAEEDKNPPEWKVYYDKDFWGHSRRGPAGEEIPIHLVFTWGEYILHVPAVYCCGGGLVIDLCIEGGPLRETEQQREEQKRRLFSLDFAAEVKINQKISQRKTGYGVAWDPEAALSEELWTDPEAEWVLEHYGLPKDRLWSIQRACFPWPSSRLKVRSLELELVPRPEPMVGTRFFTPEKGESAVIVHPVTGVEYTLTVKEFSPWKSPFHHPKGGWRFPDRANQLIFTLDPELPDSGFYLKDITPGDKPEHLGGEAGSIGIIGGADGPTAVFITSKLKKEEKGLHAAFSALRYQPVDRVEWEFIFREKTMEDLRVSLL